MTENDKKSTVENSKDEVKKLVDGELEGVTGGHVNAYKRQENNPNYMN